jgi:hypothetical protein
MDIWLDVLIVMEQIKFMIRMMEEDFRKIVNYATKKDILILKLLLALNVITLEENGHFQIREVFPVIAKDVMEKDLCLEQK